MRFRKEYDDELVRQAKEIQHLLEFLILPCYLFRKEINQCHLIEIATLMFLLKGFLCRQESRDLNLKIQYLIPLLSGINLQGKDNVSIL